MRLYTVHLRRGGLFPDRDVVLVKEGFSWPAFLFGPLWAFWHRMWWLAAGLLAAQVLIGLAGEWLRLDPAAPAVLQLAVAVGVAFVANDLRRRRLEVRGFVEADVAGGRGVDAALHRYLDTHPEILGGAA